MCTLRICKCLLVAALVLSMAGFGYAQTEAPKADAPKADAPKADAPKVEAPAVEAPKPMDEATILSKVPQGMDVVAIVKDATGLDGKIGAFLKEFLPKEMGMPPEGPQPMLGLMNELTNDATTVKAGSPLIFVVKFKESIDQSPAMAVLVDMKDFKAFVGENKPNEKGIYDINGNACAAYNGLVMFASDEEGLPELMKAPAGIKLSAPQTALWTGKDAYAMINLAALIKAVGPEYEKAHQGMVEEIKKLEAPQEGATPEQIKAQQAQAAPIKAKLKAIESLWSAGQQLDWAAGGGSLGAKGVDLQLTGSLLPGTSMAGYLNNHPALGDKLAPALPNLDSAWVAFWWSVDSKKVGQAVGNAMGGLKSIFDMALADMPEGAIGPSMNPKQLMAMFAKFEELLKTKGDLILANQGAGLAMVGKAGGIANMLTVQKVADREEYLKRTDFMNEMQKTMVNDLFGMLGGQGIKAETTFDRDAQKAGDLSLDRAVFKLTAPAGAPQAAGPDPMKMIEQMWGGPSITTWMTFAEGHMLSQVGQQPDQIAEMAKALKDGSGLADSPDIKALRQFTLKDANVVGYVSLATYTNLIMSAIIPAVAGQPMQLPPMPPAAVKVKSVFSVAAGDNRLSARIYVPVEDLKLIVSNIMMMQAMMMQQPVPDRGGNPPNNGGGAPPMM